jgi:hypothetical protein
MQCSLRPTWAALAVGLVVVASPRSVAAQAVTVSGVGYAQYRYQLSDTATNNNGFSVTRAYINVNGNLGSGLVTRITPDLFSTMEGSFALRLKYAYAAYTPGSIPLTFKLGIIHTPWLDWAEGIWVYRMQGTMSVERNGYITSADLGLGVDGAWDHQRVNMQVGLYNGEGYSGGVGDANKDVMGRVSVRLLSTDVLGSRGGLRLTGYGQYGKPTGGGVRARIIGMVSYQSSRLTVGAEGALTRDSSSATPSPLLKGNVLSGFGIYRIPGTMASLVARVDLTDPNTGTDEDRQTRFIGGISYRMHPNLQIFANIDHLDYQGTPTPAQQTLRTQALFQIEFTY